MILILGWWMPKITCSFKWLFRINEKEQMIFSISGLFGLFGVCSSCLSTDFSKHPVITKPECYIWRVIL